MDKLALALADLELGGMPLNLVRAKHPDVIIRDNGKSFQLILTDSNHIKIDEIAVPKDRDLRLDITPYLQQEKTPSFRVFFGKKRI
jgi:hypothetical protein